MWAFPQNSTFIQMLQSYIGIYRFYAIKIPRKLRNYMIHHLLFTILPISPSSMDL
jgi:hypothetical protein